MNESRDERFKFSGEKTDWRGFDRFDFLMDANTLKIRPATAAESANADSTPIEGRIRCHAVVPKTAADGAPWSWRGCYWDHEPQAEVELLKRGFHLAFIRSDPGESWVAWRAFLVREHGLSDKPAFIGMSRGGFNAYAWATSHPDFVSCICADNPAIGAESMMKLGELAKRDVPLLQVCGSLDPLLENHALAIESIYRGYGGRVSMMIKEGFGHHPHSLKDPRPIADFIEGSFRRVAVDPPAVVGESFSKRAFYGSETFYRDYPREGTHIACRGPLFSDCHDRYEFRLDGVEGGVTLFAPNAAAPGKPWAYRADYVDRGSTVDLALLARGFHIVVGPVPYNADGPILEHWNAVHRHLVDNGFSPKPVLTGAGGAAGEALAWAIENPESVSCIYGENPVFRSHMTKTPPLDRLAPLAEAGIPALYACGELDPWLNDHARAFEARYRALGGTVEIVVKEGEGHYPLSPQRLEPVIEFLVRSVG